MNTEERFDPKKALLAPFFSVPCLLGILIAFFCPDDALQRYPLLNSCYQGIKELVPLIENHAKYSAFPDVTRLYLSVAWLLLPIQVWSLFRSVLNHPGFEAKIAMNLRHGKRKLMVTRQWGIPQKYWFPIGFMVLDAVVASGFYLGKDPSFCNGCTNANYFGMFVMWNLLMPLTIASLLIVQFVWIRNLKQIYA